MLVNFAWPRAASNPEPNQTASAHLEPRPLDFLNKIPILYTVFAVVLILGVIYFFIWEVRKPLPAVHVPAEEGPVQIPAESIPPDEIAESHAVAEVDRPHDSTSTE